MECLRACTGVKYEAWLQWQSCGCALDYVEQGAATVKVP
jgi:hypothetical protein